MKEWICRELSTSTGNSENGVLMRETELIRCKDCMYYDVGENEEECWTWCRVHDSCVAEESYCSWAERKATGYFTPEEREFYNKVNREKMQDTGLNIFDFMGREKDNKVVPLHHEDIHFNSEEDEKAFYEVLAGEEEND